MRKSLPERLYWFIVFLYCFFIFFLSSKSHPLPRDVQKYFSDWFLHGVEYAILGFFLTGALRFSLRIKSFKVFLISTAVLGGLYGATDEIHQIFVPHRQCDYKDWMADVAGSICGCLFFWCLIRIMPSKKVTKNAKNQSVLRTAV